MISVEGLTVEFGVKPLFLDASFVVNDRDRIALVGKNGAGKSTMLKILCGKQQPTSGTVAVPNDYTIGYLPQVMILQDDTTVREEARKAFAKITELKEKIDELNRQLAERTDYESEAYMALVEKFTQEHERYMMMGGDNYEAEIERTLTGLGFLRTDFDRPTNEFSGGWRMRIELAKILLQKPDVLLLDEPTNHLDIESIQWLEQQLSQSSRAVVLVSHDRAFINNVTNRTLEISCGKVIDYKVKYDEYVKLRAERREQQIRAYENQQKEIADTKAFILRVYTSDDVIGVETAGSMKNAIAVVSGVATGMGLGENARAFLITRGIKEIISIVKALGGKMETAYGLSGIGDLIVTASSTNSRNFNCGLNIASGMNIEDAIGAVTQSVEGVRAIKAGYEIGKKYNLDLPIINVANEIVCGRLDAKEGLKKLLSRDLKTEKFW